MATALVLINTEVGCEEDVFEELGRAEGVVEAYIVYGVYDVVAKIEAPDMEALKDIVSKKIRRIPKIRSTITLIVVEGKSPQ